MPPIEDLLRNELKRVADIVQPDSSARCRSLPPGAAGTAVCSRSPSRPRS